MEQGTLLNISEQMRIIITCGLAVVAYLVDFLCCRLLIPVIRKIAAKTTIKWDNYLTGGKVLHYLFHLIPPVTFLVALPLLYPEQAWTPIAAKILYIYVIIVAGRLVNEFISSIYAISSDSDLLRDKPMKGVYQMLKVIVVCVAVILILGVLLERNFTSLLAGLGASAAVLMLIFKDTILGLVAGVQLSAHDMLRPGDWIIMEKYGVNGCDRSALCAGKRLISELARHAGKRRQTCSPLPQYRREFHPILHPGRAGTLLLGSMG